MKKYLKPESEVVEMDLQGMIATSPGLKTSSADSEKECLSNERSDWGDIWN